MGGNGLTFNCILKDEKLSRLFMLSQGREVEIKSGDKIWDLRSYRNDIQQSTDVLEIKDTVLNGGLVYQPKQYTG